MRRRRQLADVRRIDELATKASGELATASLLAARSNDFATIHDAADYALKNPQSVEALLRTDLYFRWISKSLTNIKRKVTELDFLKIGTYDAASQSTDAIFENVIKRINADLKRDTSGIYPCIDEIFRNDRMYNKYSATTLNQIKNIKLIADDVQRLTWRIIHPYYYIIFDRRLIVGCVAAFVVAIPIWYYFGAHGQSITALEPQLVVSGDIRQLRDILQAPTTGIFTKAANFIHFVWEFLLIVPSIFLVPAAGLAVARRRFSLRRKSVGRYEKLFGDIGKALQKVVPNPPRWSSVEWKMGDINLVIGDHNQQNVKSILNNAYNNYVKDNPDVDVDTEKFLKSVGDTVEATGNVDAAEHYAGMVENLKNKKTSMAHTMWKGLVTILPPVGEIAGVTAAMIKLFGGAA